MYKLININPSYSLCDLPKTLVSKSVDNKNLYKAVPTDYKD